MFKSTDLFLFDQEVGKFVRKNLSPRVESLRQSLSDSPTQLNRTVLQVDFTRLNLKWFKKEKDLRTLALVSWYLPKEIQILLQMELQDHWTDQSGVKEVLLTSRWFALTWFMRVSKWNESDFFGNLLNKTFVRIFNLIAFRTLPNRKTKKYTGYCRGYRENNHRSSEHLDSDLLAKLTVSEEEKLLAHRIFERVQLLKLVEEELQFLLLESSMNILVNDN